MGRSEDILEQWDIHRTIPVLWYLRHLIYHSSMALEGICNYTISSGSGSINLHGGDGSFYSWFCEHISKEPTVSRTYVQGLTRQKLAYYLPLYFQATQGVFATHSGINMIAYVAPSIVAIGITGALVSRFGFYVSQYICINPNWS